MSRAAAVFGEELILKVYRRIEPGPNPELELLRYLTEHGFEHIAQLRGFYAHSGRLVDATLGLLQEFLPSRGDGWDFVLDAVQDPGNVGTMLRTALGLGAAGAVALKGTAELASPKVVRGSMGALFRLPAVAAEAEDFLAWAAEHGVELWVAEADGEPLEPGAARGYPAAVGLVLGNEGAGVSPSLEAAARRRVAIRLAEGAESLNVAIAAAILLREVARVE